MRMHRKATVALAAAAVVAGGQLAWAGAQAAPTGRDDGASLLRADASSGLRLERDPQGVVDFVGTTDGGSVVNPGVTGEESLRDAARAHLDRYGSALGLTRASQLRATTTTATPSGQEAVRFQQSVDGAPVIGGQVVVSLRPDHQLGSMLATLSRTRALPSATVTESAARTTAARAAARSADAKGLTTTPQGRAVWDPAVFGGAGSAQGVWSFEVGDGEAVRRLVLVDDTSGRVLLDLDQVEHLDRVVCDANNVATDAVPCTSGFARTETSGPSGVDDVNYAFDHAGEVAAAYQEIAGLDLTQAIGIDVGGVKKLASTVRYCAPGYDCPVNDPYENAFWNGTQMYYGDGFANADDVVGHEMTHGVIDQYSELFYWGQSGAMNESIADIMGEVVDHRAGLEAGDADWKLAEDLSIGAIRDMKDPTSFGDPDRMTSPLYTADLTRWNLYGAYPDGGGVHQNSGVGNKTAYLISQGGTFNGQTIAGIDGGDTGLTKTGKLYFDAITRLTSGSDYANLAAVLEQSCADFAASGTAGFTTADCDNVKKAVLATELRTTPTNAPQPADAVRACPTGTTLRELFNSETGDPATKFTTTSSAIWGYGVNPDWDANATSGKTSWFGYNPDPDLYGDPTSASITAAQGIALPAGQKSFLSFNQWRLFEWYPEGYLPSGTTYVDGGTVEVDSGAGAVDASSLPWVNGPQQTLTNGPAGTNPWAGRRAFAGDSFGWTTSQVDLSSLGGKTVKPSFTNRSDEASSFIGWFLDDISVYTCDVLPVATPSAPTPPAPTPTPTPPPATKAPSTTKLKVTSKAGKVTVTAKVKASGARASGKVTFKVSGKKSITKAVKVKKGKAVLVLKGKVLDKLGKGKHKVKATYKGSDTVARSKARASFNLR
ncbi:M4 family metallopeptidase [Nocardioides zeicaulis]|uniref:M4 family metallopeptidase n=1 Tax=Nocardioides zeicaulis TaxID=1776857 RepID=A0ABV6E6P1_9ACTN